MRVQQDLGKVLSMPTDGEVKKAWEAGRIEHQQDQRLPFPVAWSAGGPGSMKHAASAKAACLEPKLIARRYPEEIGEAVLF